MDELTRITHTGGTGHDGYTIVTGWDVPLAAGATRIEALRALFHRGFTPEQAAAALNTAVRLDRIAVKGLVAD